jgi:hypothetical protein
MVVLVLLGLVVVAAVAVGVLRRSTLVLRVALAVAVAVDAVLLGVVPLKTLRRAVPQHLRRIMSCLSLVPTPLLFPLTVK